ncbi:O-antigen ligase family protein [Niallia sp. XMNu-256]|uniref:O-antigen ligase family protein n=1 Tax=Niallia sp. XMNu-256 TaxID=3082444 RepID=UPI0030D56A2C
MNRLRKYALPISLLLLLISVVVPISSFGYLATLLIGMILLFNPKQGLLFLLIYFPIRPALIEWSPSIKYVGDFIIVLLFVQALWQWVKTKPKLGKIPIFIIGFLAFCLVGTVSALITGVSIIAVIFQLRAFLITFLLILIISIQKINKRDLYAFLWTTVIMAVMMSLQGIVEKVSLRTLLIPETWSSMQLPETNRIRIYGLIGNPNVFATYLAIAFICSIYLKKVYTNYRLLLTIFSFLIFGVFLLTYSRGTFIAMIVGFIVYIALSKEWRVIKPVALSIILSLPIIYFPVVGLTEYMEQQQRMAQQPETVVEDVEVEPIKEQGDFKKRMTEAFDQNTIQASTEWGRIYIVKKGIEVFKDHPIIGTGFGTFGDSASLSYPSPILEEYQIPSGIYSDNQYIQVITQTGILGVISFAIFIIGMIVLLWKKRKQVGGSILFISILVGASAAGLLYNIWEDKTFTLYFYIFLGYTLNKSLMEKERLN